MELVAWIIGGLCALVVLRNKKTWEGGIGPNTIRALTIVLGVPLILTLSAQKILEGQTVGAIVGGLLAIGVQKDRDGNPPPRS
jgi:hypothetical protein